MAVASGWITMRAWADGALHITPISDLIKHELADDCVCGPDTVPVERDDGSVGFYFLHHSLDGREANE